LKLAIKEKYEIIVMLLKHFVILNQLKKNNKYLTYIVDNNIIINVATIIFNNYDKFYIKFKQDFSNIKQFEKQIHSKFKQ